MKKKILVDISATIIHHGHIRLLKKAHKLGNVIVALTTDKEILKKKKINKILSYKERKEIIESIKFVKKVIPSNWQIDNNFLIKNDIDFLVHGNDNKNDIPKKKLKIFPRTKGISSSIIRKKIIKNYLR